ncbi:M23 family metallopeptidase [Streptomyces sp. CAU 1734]|uniref:M23 family metallopeptidase n=1 Tax=Streptomyces sp. CAU 1734 TaxID=3140360 RepID=UPI003261342F
MNDQHAHAGHVGNDDYSTGSYGTDPFYGALPDGQAGYDAGQSGQYDTGQWDTGAHPVTGYPAYDIQDQGHQFGGHEAGGQYDTAAGQTPGGQYDTGVSYEATGQWDATGWDHSAQTGQFETGQFETGQFEAGRFEAGRFEAADTAFSYDTGAQWAVPAFGTGSFDATAWNTGTETGAMADVLVPQQFTPEHEFGQEFGAEFAPELTGDAIPEQATELLQEVSEGFTADTPAYGSGYETEFDSGDLRSEDLTGEDLHSEGHLTGLTEEFPSLDGDTDFAAPVGATTGADDTPEWELDPITAAAPITPRPVRRSGGSGSRGRRRTPAKRSALFTVAVPSACVMGVAGIAAASVGDITGGESKKTDNTKLAAADVAETEAKTAAANNKMDTQLAALNAEARDFGDRASRTQERIDLQVRQEADRKKRIEEAKRREALRPKFALPVKSKVLSTYYGESGVNWMSLHTGIDFPLSFGANIYAATDGTIRTQFHNAYGNMIILTAPDGTETWYCHLSSAKIRSGTVKAGDVIGYAGNTGNSTGVHLHFEVRPGGGATVDPLQWLRSKDLKI